MKRTVYLVLFAAIVWGVSGCMTPMPDYNSYMKPVEFGVLKPDGTTITSVSGDFVIKAGEPFKPPFRNTGLSYDANSRKMIFWMGASKEDRAKIIEKYDKAVKWGGRKVRVKSPYSDKDLYGVLWLSDVHQQASGPAARSYLIDVPRNRVEAALGGRVSVLYEIVKFKYQGMTSNTSGSWYDDDTFSWVLWLSDMPFTELIRYVGVGYRSKAVPEGQKIEGIFPDSPAEQGGLRIGDVVSTFNGVSVVGMAERDYVNLTRNKSIGEQVRLIVERQGLSEPMEISLTVGDVSY